MTQHFSLKELTQSYTATRLGIRNVPNNGDLISLMFTAVCMEVVRSVLGDNRIFISSGFRSKELNEAIRGSDKSQHMRGQAVDFTCPGFGDPVAIARRLEQAGINYDQLIVEGDWVHVSFVKMSPRRQILTKKFTADGVKYIPGIVE